MTSGETNGEDGNLNNGRIRFEGLRGVWSPFGQEWIFIMTEGHGLSRGVLKMRIMHGHLGEVSVCRTSERMWKNEV